ncbi:hypothetical protein ACLQ28_00855 [Micromonospora sp. DT201]|uniref:hypothetical protein n=1 Tax=Micromonospora sp. DT201 TaxID=3393442 RepID=UPI003CF88583
MSGSARKPRTGDVLHLTRAASVQFLRPIFVRVIRVLDWPTYDGWPARRPVAQPPARPSSAVR